MHPFNRHSLLLILLIVMPSCANIEHKHTGKKPSTRSDSRRKMVIQKASQKLIKEAKGLMLAGDYSAAFVPLELIDYFRSSPHQQRQCEILMEHWVRNKPFVSGGKMPEWYDFIGFVDVDALTAKIEDDTVYNLNLEMRLRNYEDADRILKSLKLQDLKENDRLYCQGCREFLKLALENDNNQ